jgi:RIO kinase 1
MPKISREKFKVYKNVFDQATLNNLFRLSSRGHFLELTSPISMGKEANVFYAETEDGSYVVVKIYRVENCNFNKMYDYIKQDPRFIGMRKQRRQIIFSWVQREYRNLMKSREAGVTVPQPIAVLDNVLVMEFVGNQTINPPEPALELKDSPLENKKKLFDKILDNMKKLHKVGLVHADLSSFNILDKDGEPYFIDFSQATTNESQDYFPFLTRDVKNVCNFFNRNGMKLKPEELFEKITGKKMIFDL